MAQNLLTAADVYQPIQALDVVKLMAMKDEMEGRQTENRINYLKLGQAEFEKQQQDKIVQSYGGADKYAQAMAQQQQQKTYMDQAKTIFEAYNPILEIAKHQGASGNELFHQTVALISKAGKDNPYLQEMSDHLKGVTLLGEDEFKTTGTFKASELEAFEKKYPDLKDKLAGIDITQPVSFTFKNGKTEEVKNVKDAENENETSTQIVKAALKEQLKRNPTAVELADEMDRREAKRNQTRLNITVAGAQARGKAYADERFYNQYDTKTGKTIRVKGKYLGDSDKEGRYIDPSDPTLKADTESLEKITKGMDSIKAFDIGATKALDYSLTVAKDFGLGKYPQANKVSQLFKYYTGDPKVKGLKNSLTTAATEYMKVINAGSDLTASELTVMGQQRAKEIIESADNIESIENSIKIMKNEMQISSDKFPAQRKEIQNRMKGYGTGEPQAESKPTGSWKQNKNGVWVQE